MSPARALLLVLVAMLGLAPAQASDSARIPWTRDPDLVPWETMTLSGDGERTPARTLQAVAARREAILTRLETSRLARPDRAEALAELGDLFRDEARLVLAQDAENPWRVDLRTSPAWLQLELALRWYDQAVQVDPSAVDDDGRLTLLRAVLLARLGEGAAFDTYVKVIRTYRGTPYVEMAKLAVGDHHFRAGNLDKARSAYRMVRKNRDPELSGYARYRLASVHAAQGAPDEALEILLELVDEDTPGPLGEMLRDAARSALANHLAARLGLVELIEWMHRACRGDDAACRRDLRAAAAETYATQGQDRFDAWLRTVDATPRVQRDLDLRIALARAMLVGTTPQALLFKAEDACAPADASCRSDQAYAVSTFFEEAGDPGGNWVSVYTRLPRLPARPAVQQLVAESARAPRPPAEELAAMEALCAERPSGCKARLRSHLRAVWGRLDRQRDSAWLRFVDQPPPVPGGEAARARLAPLVRARAPAAEVLGILEPGCAGDTACMDELYEILVGYYAAIGMERDASWLIAVKTLPELPIPERRRTALRQAALDGEDAKGVVTAVLGTCPVIEPGCFEASRLATEAFFRTAGRLRQARWLADLSLLGETRIEEAAFPILVEAAISGAPATPVLRRLDAACAEGPPHCGPDARRVLAAWYDRQSAVLDRRTVEAVDAPPDLGDWQRLGPAFLRVIRTAPDAAEASRRVRRLCPFMDDACGRTLRRALASWYDTHGRPEDAARVRQDLGTAADPPDGRPAPDKSP